LIKVINNFFTKEECQKIVESIIFKKDHWTYYPTPLTLKEHKGAYILGNSLYRNLLASNFIPSAGKVKYVDQNIINKAHENYYKRKKEIEAIEDKWVFDLLLQKFKEKLDMNCFYMHNFSKPGFPILTETLSKSWHYDDEKKLYPYNKEFPDYIDLTYFDEYSTITIMLSKGDFTFDYYENTSTKYNQNNTPPHCKDHAIEGICNNCNLGQYKTINYEPGDLVLQLDRMLHRSGKSIYNQDKYRITIQGHCVKKDNKYYLYW